MAGIDQRAHVLWDQIIKHFGLGTGAPPRPLIHLIGKLTINLKISMLINWFIPHWTGISLGGLACQKLVTMPNLEFDIMSVTMVGTPHQGTKVASMVNNITLCNNHLLHSSYTVTLTLFLLDKTWLCSFLPSFLSIGDGQALDNLTPQAMSNFNTNILYLQGSRVRYFSCGAKIDPRMSAVLWVHAAADVWKY